MDSSSKQHILEKEIDLIQSCISRMAQNSFWVKGGFVTLISASVALIPKEMEIWKLCIIYFCLNFCFWCLDAFYLRLERMYRWKYEWVITNRLSNDRFYYDLNPENDEMWLPDKENKERKIESIGIIMLSKSMRLYHFCAIFLMILFFVRK